MALNETAKSQTIESLNSLNIALGITVSLYNPTGGAANQLKVFSAVVRHLPAAVDVFASTKTVLELMTEETDEIKGNYLAIQQAADDCHRETQYLQELYKEVSWSLNKADGYREAAKQGKPVEKAIMELLLAAKRVAMGPLGTPNHVMALQSALKEVEMLPSSLAEETLGGGVVLNNSGPGSQYYNVGRGHMNHSSGGVMITGENARGTFHYGSRQAKKNEASVVEVDPEQDDEGAT